MGQLTKIHEVSARYGVTARTLRYYEDVGLIKSIRTDDYAYRMYDDDQMKRLEQILVLRKLDIGVKDIKRIFGDQNAGFLFDVLKQKVKDIDDEVALLHELKQIVLKFIRQLGVADFKNSDDVQKLYESASMIERQLMDIDDDSSEAPDVERMAAVTEQLSGQPDVWVYELPACRMAEARGSTSWMNEADSPLNRFDRWFSDVDKRRVDKFFARDFMWYDGERDQMVWWYAVPEHEPIPDWLDEVAFEGGFYAAGISRDEDDVDGERVLKGIRKWVEATGYFTLDERAGHQAMYHIVGTQVTRRAMGYSQLALYVPVALRAYPNQRERRDEVERARIRRRINDGGNLHFDLLGEGAHMEKRQHERYKVILGENGSNSTVYDIRLDGLSMEEIARLIDEIKALNIHVWWDICFPEPVNELIFGVRPPAPPEPNDRESYIALFASEVPDYPRPDTSIQLERVTDAETFALWANKVNEFFDEGELVHPVHHYLLAERGNWACYIGRIDGEPVGVCCTMRSGDLAWLHFTATAPGFRRRGVARALCTKAISEAVADGASIIASCAWPSVKVLARELGFSYY